MQFGYFDDVAREYVITRPDTPRSWINYLGSRLYGGIITQNAGGYSFFRSGGTGRIMRMRFNGVPADEPGRYLYLRDDAGSATSSPGEFWSASWQPVGTPLDRYDARVRHGLGYSVFEAECVGIRSELTCFVPTGQAFEYWSLVVTNPGAQARTISVFSYAELANDWSYRQDLENLQYSQYVVQADCVDGMIHRRNRTREAHSEVWFGVAGADVVGFDTDRDLFLGPYRTQADPLAVERGECSSSRAVGDNSCASLHVRLELAPGESRQVIFCLGVGNPDLPWRDRRSKVGQRPGEPDLRPGRELMAEYATPERVDAELESIRTEWAAHLAPLQVSTPDPELDSMVNVWNAYQTHMTFNWSRGVSLVEAGDRDGLGYRDTVQDMLAVTHAIPGAVRERLDMILTGQTAEGSALPLVKPLTHNPGHEKAPALERYRSDDALWLPITVANFVYETGDLGYLDEVLPYADTGEATVFDHLIQALVFSLAHRGVNGLVQGLAADWNDCIQFGTTGESMFSTFLLANGLRITRELASAAGRDADAHWCADMLNNLAPAIDAAWDGEWFIRGISATGAALGSHLADEGQIYLEPNVWAAISGAASRERALTAMDSVRERLASEHGAALCDPPHTKPMPGIGLSLLVFPVGHKENGGIFCHAASWTIVAEALLGRGDRAYEYYRSFLPARYNETAEVHQVEPYVYCQFTHGPTSPRFGQARNSWLTGTASWSYIGVTQYLLGVRPELEGLRVDPCIPAAWDGFEMVRTFRGKSVRIRVSNPDHVSHGVAVLEVDGQPVPGCVAPADLLRDGSVVAVRMG
jgi:N,N'-diacetylchitobiose phosphorylase